MNTPKPLQKHKHTLLTVILGGASGRVASVATQGAVGTGAGRPPLTRGFFPVALDTENTRSYRSQPIALRIRLQVHGLP